MQIETLIWSFTVPGIGSDSSAGFSSPPSLVSICAGALLFPLEDVCAGMWSPRARRARAAGSAQVSESLL